MAPIAPFVPTIHELRYLWNVPVGMSNAKLVAELGHEPHTSLDEAVEAALVGTGCLATTETPTCSPSVLQIR